MMSLIHCNEDSLCSSKQDAPAIFWFNCRTTRSKLTVVDKVYHRLHSYGRLNEGYEKCTTMQLGEKKNYGTYVRTTRLERVT
jgi:hypothetical protein